MTPDEKHKQRCKEYYRKTKDNLSEETKQKRREQGRIRSYNFYLRNKELCIQRSIESRRKNNTYTPKPKVIKPKVVVLKKNCKITDAQIKFVKSFDLFLMIKKRPRLRIWDKKISDWNVNDFNKFKKLTQ
jgi:monomeric isocitrate dehydrogenase